MPALLCGPLKNCCSKIRAPKKVRTYGTNFSTAEPSFAGFCNVGGAPGPWPLLGVRLLAGRQKAANLGERETGSDSTVSKGRKVSS